MKLSLRHLLGTLKTFGAALHHVGRRKTSRTLNKHFPSLTVEALEDRLVPAPLLLQPRVPVPIHHPGESYLNVTGVPTQITAGTSFSITITDYDSYTGAVTGFSGSVALTENSGGYYGTAWSLGTATLSGGVGHAVVTPTVAGTVTIIADAGPVGYANTDLRAESGSLLVNPGAAASLVISAPSLVSRGVPFSVSITAKDAYGNTATGFNQSVQLSASDRQGVTPSTILESAGIGSTSITLGTADALNLMASAGAITGVAPITVAGISSLSTTVGYAPGYSAQYLQTGSEVDITGGGFRVGAKVIFGDPGTANPSQLLQFAKQAGVGATPNINSNGTWMSVNVPRYAVNGPITVVEPDGTALTSSQSFTVNNYRNTFAYSFENFGYNVTWGMLKDEFGGNQVDITIPNPFGSSIDTGVPNPIALGVWGIAAATLNGKGTCFGIALTSVLMSEYHTNLINGTNGLPAGAAATVFNLQLNDPLRTMLEDNHLAQISQEVIINYLSWQVTSHSASSIYNQISSLLSAGHHPLISLESGADHAVVAYNLEPGPKGNGDYYIDVYDPNRPLNGPATFGLDPTENMDLSMHVQIEQASRIYIDPANGWSFTMLNKGNDHGGWGSIQVVPVSLVSNGMTFPGNFNEILTGGALTVFFADTASQVHTNTAPAIPQSSHWIPVLPSSSAPVPSLNPQNHPSLQVALAEHHGQAYLGFFEMLGMGEHLIEPLAGSHKAGSTGQSFAQ